MFLSYLRMICKSLSTSLKQFLQLMFPSSIEVLTLLFGFPVTLLFGVN